MITIISGTNRYESETERIAETIYKILSERVGDQVQLLKLFELPKDFIHPEMYAKQGQSPAINKIQDQYMRNADKFWFVFPEYNGGVPGILKLFIDAISVRDLGVTFHNKKACLTGISSGRAGNLRGMDHFASVLNYLKVIVWHNRLPISSIHSLLGASGEIEDEQTIQVLTRQAEEFIDF